MKNNNKMKQRLLAIFCAITLLAPYVIQDSGGQVEAAQNTQAAYEAITWDGDDFEFKYDGDVKRLATLKNRSSFDGTIFSMKFKFTTTTEADAVYFGYKSGGYSADGCYGGIMIRCSKNSTTGEERIQIGNHGALSTTGFDKVWTPEQLPWTAYTVTASQIFGEGKTVLKNEELLLQIATQLVDADEDGKTNDIKVYIGINGRLCTPKDNQNYLLIKNGADKLGNMINLQGKTRNSTQQAYEEHSYDVNGNAIHNYAYQSLNDATCTEDGHKIGVCLVEGCGNVTQPIVDEGSAGHLWTNYVSNGDGTETAICDRQGCEETNTREASVAYESITWNGDDFEFKYEGNVKRLATLRNLSSFDRTIFSMKCKFTTTTESDAIYYAYKSGGYSTDGCYGGIMIRCSTNPNTGEDRIQIGNHGALSTTGYANVWTPEQLPYTAYTVTASQILGEGKTVLKDEELLLQIATTLVDADGDEKRNDVKVYIAINGVLCTPKDNQDYLLIKDGADKLGNMINLQGQTRNSTQKAYTEHSYDYQYNPIHEYAYYIYNGDGTETGACLCGNCNVTKTRAVETDLYKKVMDYDFLTLKDINKPDRTGSFAGMYSRDDLDKTLFSMKVKYLNNGARLHLGTVKNSGLKGYGGISFRIEKGNIIVGNEVTGQSGDGYLHNLPTTLVKIQPDKAGVSDTFLDKEILLQIAIEYVERDGDGKKNDIELGIFINGTLYGNQFYYIKDNAEQMGVGVNFNEGTCEYASYNYLKDFAELSASDFGLEDVTDSQKVFEANETLQSVAITCNMKFPEKEGSKLYFGGRDNGIKLETTGNGTIKVSYVDAIQTETDIVTLTPKKAQVSSFSQSSHEWRFEFQSQKVGPLNCTLIGIYIDGVLYDYTYYTSKQIDLSGLKQIIGIHVPNGTLEFADKQYDELSYHDFSMLDINLKPVEKEYYKANYRDWDTLDGTAVTGIVNFGTSGGSRLQFGNSSWYGIVMIPRSKSTMWIGYIHPKLLEVDMAFLDAEKAGVSSFVGEDLNIRLAFDFLEVEDGTTDLKIGVFINGKLYDNKYFTMENVDVKYLAKTLTYRVTKGSFKAQSIQKEAVLTRFGFDSNWKKTLGIK